MTDKPKSLADVKEEIGDIRERLACLQYELEALAGEADERNDNDALDEASSLEYGVELALRELSRAERRNRYRP